MDKLQCQIEKPKKINVTRVEIDYGDGKFIELTDKEYEEVIFWNEGIKQWDSNSIRLIPKK